jgi:hypothetical protein
VYKLVEVSQQDEEEFPLLQFELPLEEQPRQLQVDHQQLEPGQVTVVL